jgi:hypothetical protein
MNVNKPLTLTSLDTYSTNPYFFSNSNIDSKIYIAQRANDEENALYIIDVWNLRKFNPSPTDEILTVIVPFNRYLYNNNDDIKLERVGGGDDSKKVLYFKYNDKISCVALLAMD